MCGITIFVNPGDPIFQQINVFDSLGKQVGRLERLREPVVEHGVKYTYAVHLKVAKGVGYVLRAQAPEGRKAAAFSPQYSVRLDKKQTQE
jgi:hypothetical protein